MENLNLLEYLNGLRAVVESPQYQALRRAEAAREKQPEKPPTGFPARAMADARRFLGGPVAEQSEVLRWALEAMRTPPWAKGGSLIMTGGWGSGKTTAACALVLRWVGSARYLKAFLAGKLDGPTREETLDKYAKCGLLVIDQIHQLSQCSPWVVSVVKGLIDTRYDAERNTILLSTVPARETVEILGPEMIDRCHPRLRWEAPAGNSKRWR